MRREVLRNAINRVNNDLIESGIVAMLGRATEQYQNSSTSDKSRTEWLSLATLAEYFNKANLYSDVEKEILSIMDLDSLLNPSTWQSSFSEFDPSFVFGMRNKVRQLTDFLPRVMALLERKYVDEPQGELENSQDLIVQRVILVDEGESLSTPERIIELLHAVQQIYDIICQVNSVDNSQIAVVGLDSGSEKSFDFLGMARLMHELRETLQVAYNMIAFHRQNVTVKNLQVAGETLSVVEKISRMEQDGSIDSEQANRMRHGLFTGLEKFAATGAYTPEMAKASVRPEVAMKPQPRLLTGPARELAGNSQSALAAKPDSTNEPSDDGEKEFYSDEEIATAIKMLKRAKSAPSGDQQNKRKPRKKID